MALPVVQSTSQNKAAASSVVVTAPTGITTGDLLIGSYTAFRGVGAFTANTPAGWTVIQSASAEAKSITHTFYKVAVLADEAAPNYTFTTTTADQISGSIQRITGAAAGSEITVSEKDTIASNASTTISHTAASTPPTGESLLVLCTGGYDLSITAIVTTSTYSATPTVTWTEQSDQGFRDGLSDGSSHAVATAPYTGSTEFTAYGFVTSEILNFINSVLIIVTAPVDAAGTNALHEASPTLFTNAGVESGTTGTNTLMESSPTFFDQSGRATTPTVWTNEDKPSTTWTNESL